MHEKHEIHTSSSHPDFPFSSKASAATGHTATQAPQPIQVSLSTVTGIIRVLLYELHKVYHPTILLVNANLSDEFESVQCSLLDLFCHRFR